MKNHLYVQSGLAAAAFLLFTAFTLAQTTPGSKREHPRNVAIQQSAGSQNQTANGSSIAVDHAGGNGVRRMDRGNSGRNPKYESKDKAATKPKTKTPTVEYKDPEDMTTRYRPGNNKTTVKRDGNSQSRTTSPRQ